MHAWHQLVYQLVYPSVHVATLVLASLIVILLLWQSMADRQDR